MNLSIYALLFVVIYCFDTVGLTIGRAPGLYKTWCSNPERFPVETNLSVNYQSIINQSILFFNVDYATNSYFKDHGWEEQLKGNTRGRSD